MSDFSWADVLRALVRGDDLDEHQAGAAMRSIMSGEATPGQIAAFLVALRAKGETVDEITGLARVMREFSLKVQVDGPVVDTCGTGGDAAGTANISTMAALVVAGAGVKVAKHGNRAQSSKCGSADLLEALGVAIDLAPEGVAICIEEAGIGFCYAPAFHPSMRHAGPVRKDLGIPTVFNFLGPLTNPAGAKRQTIGVADEGMAPKLAEAVYRLGAERALVFRGHDGLDELSTTTTSSVWGIGGPGQEDGGVAAFTFDPASLGLKPAKPEDLVGGSAEENARLCAGVLAGGDGPLHDAVTLNAAAALLVAGSASDLADGLARARESLDSGAAANALDRMRDVSQRVRPE
ncbi:MAG: anthranilate phosphoribosyltransferase [Actinomycetota bacterium]